MTEILELKVCPNLEYIGLKIDRDQFIELADDSEYKNKYFKINVEDVVLLHTVYFEKDNGEIQVIQVNLNDASVGNREIEVITELIQRNIKYQAVIVYVYKEYLDAKTFKSHYKVVVPKIHNGIKKDIFVVDSLAKTNLIHIYELKEIFETFEEYIKNRNVPVNEVINRFYKHIDGGKYGYFEYLKDSEEETEDWPLVASKWVEFIEKENLPEDPQIHIEDGHLFNTDWKEYITKKTEAIERRYGKTIDELFDNATDEEIDEYERYGDDAIADIFNEKYKQNWISKAKQWVVKETLERYQDIYGYELIEEFFDMLFYDLEDSGNERLLTELNEMYHDFGYGE